MGLAVGDNGWVASYSGRHQWIAQRVANMSAQLTAVWVDPSGREAIAVGRSGTMLVWSAGEWREAKLPATSGEGVFLDVGANEREVWIRDSTTVSVYSRGDLRWLRAYPDFAASRLWTQPPGGTIWVAGVSQPQRDERGNLVYPKRREGYKIRWSGTGTSDSVTGVSLLPAAAWMGDSSRCGIVAGNLLRDTQDLFSTAFVTRDGSFHWPNPDSSEIRAIWTNGSCTAGWIVGSRGVARLRTRKLGFLGMKSEFGSLSDLSGVISLYVDSGVPVPTIDKIQLVSGADTVELQPGTHFSVSTHGSRTLKVEVYPEGRRRAEQLNGRLVRLRFMTSYAGSLPRYPVTFEKATAFTYAIGGFAEGIPNWVWWAGGLSVAVLSSVWLMSYLESVRTLLFTNTGVAALEGLKLGIVPKLVNVLVLLSLQVRKRAFRSYAQKLLKEQGEYDPIMARFSFDDPDLSGSIGTAKPADQLALLLQVIRQKQGVWCVEHAAGAKTPRLKAALAILAGRDGEIPVMLDLDGTVPLEDQIRNEWERLGDLSTGIPELWKQGGFTFLLDGSREEREPTATDAFIRKVRDRNIVIVLTRSSRELPRARHARLEEA
jgi:hypothetical protein